MISYSVLTFHIGVCDSSPCYNGGNCTIEDGKYACECPDGFSGNRCETSKYPIVQ